MSVDASQICGIGRRGTASEFVLRVFVSTILGTALVPSTPVLADEPPTAQGQPDENGQSEPSTSPLAPNSFCQALATAAAINALPVDFFTRLLWQESRFKPDVVSRAGAQGLAQFMPETARLRGLENPFDPLEAVVKSAELLRDLHREFGNLGLAAAAYNAGPKRVHDWLDGRRPLPGETRAYVRIVTGRAAEEWVGGQKEPVEMVEMPAAKDVPCPPAAAILVQPSSDALPPKVKIVKPWGVEVVGGPTPAKALARYREWQLKYSVILADREPHVVIRGVIGEMGAARVRVGADTRAEAAKLCADLRAAGTYCDVLRN
jgi:hypothetical protein